MIANLLRRSISLLLLSGAIQVPARPSQSIRNDRRRIWHHPHVPSQLPGRPPSQLASMFPNLAPLTAADWLMILLGVPSTGRKGNTGEPQGRHQGPSDLR